MLGPSGLRVALRRPLEPTSYHAQPEWDDEDEGLDLTFAGISDGTSLHDSAPSRGTESLLPLLRTSDGYDERDLILDDTAVGSLQEQRFCVRSFL